jgi:tetratricopeptide (TPR) repeat protein
MTNKRISLCMFLLISALLAYGQDHVSILISGDRLLINAEGRFRLGDDILEEDASLLALFKARCNSGAQAIRYIMRNKILDPPLKTEKEGISLIEDLIFVKEISPNKIFSNGQQQIDNQYVLFINLASLQNRVSLLRQQPWLMKTFQIEYDRNRMLFNRLSDIESQSAMQFQSLQPLIKKINASEWVRKGMQLDNQAAQAQNFDQAVKLDPDYMFALFQRGMAYYRIKAYEKALADFNRILERHPDWTEVILSRGMVQGNLGNYQDAIDDCNFVLKRDPKVVAALLNRGIAYNQTAQLDAAMADYRQVLLLDPGHVVANYNMGCIYAIKGEASAACQSIEAALKNGYSDIEAIRRDPDLESLRENPDFQALLENYQKKGL